MFDKIHIHQGHRLPFIISALLCWLLPVIPVIVVLNSKEGYNVPLYSNFCFPSSIELVYYTAVLPENILFTIGVSFLYIVIWKLLKVLCGLVQSLNKGWFPLRIIFLRTETDRKVSFVL